jgi:nitrogen fixation NifU-like protein
VGKITGKCGDTIEIYLRVENDLIQEASFFTDGCAYAVACGSMVAELVTGKDMDEAAHMGGDTILEALGGVPEEESHCAFLAAETLLAAIHEWMTQQPR